MCLQVFAKLEDHAQGKVGAQRLADASSLQVRKQATELGQAFQFSASGSCSCDLLAKGKSDESQTWNLTEERLDGLAKAVVVLSKEARDFTFCARWLGEELEPSQRIKVAALANLIRSNSLGRNVPYQVGAHG